MRWTTKSLAAAAALALVATPAAAQDRDMADEQDRADPQQEMMNERQEMARETGIDAPSAEEVRALIEAWPETANQAANAMIEKYGAPDGATSTMLVWNDNGPWTTTIVYREPVQHDFPMPHEDVLEQVIHYDVPAEKFDELARYDGSVIAERTKGTLAARCDKEGANFLALNLAHEIITEEKTVEEAREAYAEAIKAKMDGNPPETMKGFAFDLPTGDTSDPGEAVIDMSAETSNEASGEGITDGDPVAPADIEKDAPKPELEDDEDRPATD